jgi:hypothetical protein
MNKTKEVELLKAKYLSDISLKGIFRLNKLGVGKDEITRNNR